MNSDGTATENMEKVGISPTDNTTEKGSKMENATAQKERRTTEAEVLEAVKNGATDAGALARALGMSESNARYRLRGLKRKEQGNGSPFIREAVSEAVESMDADGVASEVLTPSINPADYIPKVRDAYRVRDLDALIVASALRACGRVANSTPLLIGDAGSGKTTLAEQVAGRMKLPFLRVACDDSATLKLFIGKAKAVKGSTFYLLGLLSLFLTMPCVILFDEFNALPPSKLFFLHEVLDGRRFFNADAGAGRMVEIHDGALIFLACNPTGAKYAGTNSMNCALIDRVAPFVIPTLTPDEVPAVFQCADDATTDGLKRFFVEAGALIRRNGLRVVLSLRGVQRVAQAHKSGESIFSALSSGILNNALMTAGQKERDALLEVARLCFPTLSNERGA